MKAALLIAIQILVVVSVNCTPCTRVQSLNITTGVKYENGSVIHDGLEFKSDAWYEVEEDGVVSILGCPCIGRICVHRCCGSGSMFYNTTCTESNASAINPFSPAVYKGRELTEIQAHEHFFYLYVRPCAESYLVDSGASSEELYLQEVSQFYIFKSKMCQKSVMIVNGCVHG